MRLGDKVATMARRGAPAPAYGGLCFTAEVANSSMQLSAAGSAPAVNLIKSFDGENWNVYSVGDVVSLPNIGDKVYLAAGEGGNARFGSSTVNYNHFVFDGKIAASGNITSLLNYNFKDSITGSPYCFARLFYSCDNLLTAPELKITNLGTSTTYAYREMFSGCTGLTSAPELPATTLQGNCYYGMFSGCTGLTSAPELPATTLVTSCYREMFSGCTKLSSIKVNFTTAWGINTTKWLDGVAAVGTFYKPSALSAEYGTGKIPTGWSVVNIY